MSTPETFEIVERMMRVASSGGLGECDAETIDSASLFNPLIRHVYEAQQPWRVRNGQRMPWLRSALLRVLAPYVERQDELNGLLSATVVLLADEIARLDHALDEMHSATLERESAR